MNDSPFNNTDEDRLPGHSDLMSDPATAPASREVQLESWLRAVRHLRSRGLEPVVPATVSWHLLEEYDMKAAGTIELPWYRSAA